MKTNHLKMLLHVFRTAFTYSSRSIIIFLKNNLTNICGEISKIEMNKFILQYEHGLYLQYEEFWKVQYEKMGRRWMYFTLLTKIIRDLWL